MAENTPDQRKPGTAPSLCGPHCLPRYATEGEIDTLKGHRDELKATLARERQQHADALGALRAENTRLRSALEHIASWGEGDPITGAFDEPHAAKTARAALLTPPCGDTR
jgi:hypothetical protein